MQEIEKLLQEAESKGFLVSANKHNKGNLHTIILYKKRPYKIFFLKNVERWVEIFYRIYNLPLEEKLAVKEIKEIITS